MECSANLSTQDIFFWVVTIIETGWSITTNIKFNVIKKCMWLPEMPLMLLGGVSSSQLPGLMIYIFSPCSTWGALKFYAQWGLLTSVPEHKLPGKPFWKRTPVILLRKGMFSEGSSLEMSEGKCCPLSAGDREESGPPCFMTSTYLSMFVACVS